MTWRQCQFGDYRRLRSGRKSVETALEIPFIWDAIQDGFGCTTRLREVVRDTAFFFPTVEERRVETGIGRFFLFFSGIVIVALRFCVGVRVWLAGHITEVF